MFLFQEILSQEDPYHIDTLLQLAELSMFSEDVETATELIEKAVFMCQVAFHPSFSLASGQSRLPYKYPENRSFYIAVMRHIRFVGEKGGYLTALELCKVLYNLEPKEDPLALLMVMDFYALYVSFFLFKKLRGVTMCEIIWRVRGVILVL
jgi:hypothetical protein